MHRVWPEVTKKILNVLCLLFLIGPVLIAILSALQSEASLVQDVTSLWPREFTLDNFRTILGRDVGSLPYVPPNLEYVGRAFQNSVTISAFVVTVTLSCGACAAYAVARWKARWLSLFMYGNLAVRLIPPVAIMTPLFVILRAQGLLNSHVGIVATEVALLLPYTIWILAPFFSTIPREIEEAARVDGLGRLGILLRIVLPLSAPGLASAGAIVFILSWNEFFVPLVVTTRPEMMTMPVLMSSFVSDYYIFYTLLMAITVMALAPSVLIALLLRRYVVQGLAAGAVKG